MVQILKQKNVKFEVRDTHVFVGGRMFRLVKDGKEVDCMFCGHIGDEIRVKLIRDQDTINDFLISCTPSRMEVLDCVIYLKVKERSNDSILIEAEIKGFIENFISA